MNIAELLKYAPSDCMELYLTTEGWCSFECVFNDVGKRDYIRLLSKKTSKKIELNSYGKMSSDGECLLYPGPDKTWENWQQRLMPQCIGTVIVDKYNEPFIVTEYYLYPTDPNQPFSIIRFHKFDYECAKFATPEETKKFNKELYDNGFCYSVSEKLVIKIDEDEKKANDLGKMYARQYLRTTFDLSKGPLVAGDEADFVFSNEECKLAAAEMAKYKDEEFKKFLKFYFKFGDELFEKFKNKDYVEEIND